VINLRNENIGGLGGTECENIWRQIMESWPKMPLQNSLCGECKRATARGGEYKRDLQKNKLLYIDILRSI